MYSPAKALHPLTGFLEPESEHRGVRRWIELAAAREGASFPAAGGDGGADCAGPGVEVGAVLIVEDDAMVALQIEDALMDDGFTICGVSATAKGGLALFHERRPEFAVLDVRLAEGDGRDVARQIAAISPHTTILMCTAEDEDNLQGIGAHALLRKPFDFGSIGAALVTTRHWSQGGESPAKTSSQLVRLRSGRCGGKSGRDRA
jgi:two-component system, response regulator PdtaR